MRKKEMIEKIEELEKRVDFLASCHNDKVYIEKKVYIGKGVDALRVPCVSVRYFQRGKAKRAIISWVWDCEVINVDCDSIIVCCDKKYYYNIDKATERAVEIPKPAFVLEKELAEKKASAKKKAEKSK